MYTILIVSGVKKIDQYVFVKHIIFKTVKLQPEWRSKNFARKKDGEMSRGKSSKIFKRATLQNSFRKISLVESVINKMIEIDARNAILIKAKEFFV